MTKRNTICLLVFCLFCCLLIGCGDDSSENDNENLNPDAKLSGLSNEQKLAFCESYIPAAKISEKTTCNIDGNDIEVPAVTASECVKGLEKVPDCTVQAYNDCASVISKDRCGFDLKDCPSLAECIPPTNTPAIMCNDSEGVCTQPRNYTDSKNTICNRYLNQSLCITLSVMSLGIYNIATGADCITGWFYDCHSPRTQQDVCVIDRDSCKDI